MPVFLVVKMTFKRHVYKALTREKESMGGFDKRVRVKICRTKGSKL